MLNLFIANGISFLLLSYLGENLLEYRFATRKIHYISMTLLVFVLTVINGVDEVTITNTLLLTLGYFLFLLLNYKTSFVKTIIVLVTYMICYAVGEIIIASFLNALTGLNSFSSRSSLLFTTAIVLVGGLTFLLSTIFIKITRFSYWRKLPKYTYLITVLPITTMLLILNIDDYFYLLRNNRVLILILIGLLLSNMIIIFVFLKTINFLEIKNELEITKAEKHYSELKYQILNQQFKTNFTFMHDTIRSLLKIENLIGKNNEGFKAELSRLNKEMLRGLNIVNSNSSVISPIINYRLKDMLKSHIDFKSVIEYTDFYFIDIYDLRAIFDTILDYGIIQCDNSNNEAKIIILKTKQIEKQIVIQLLYSHNHMIPPNTYSQNYEKISFIIKRYNGIISCESIDNDSSIESLIIVFNTVLYKREE